MRLAAVQTNLFWEDAKANYKHIQQQLKAVSNVDLIVLPEMFPSGFSMNPSSISESENGPSLKWMQTLAKSKNAVVVGSVAVYRQNKYYNSLFWVSPNGEYSCYNKKHLFTMAGEHKHYSKGDNLLLTTISSFKCCPLICYDLRFPVWSRNINTDLSFKYDLLIYVANWPSVREDAWITLLKARAIENQCYVIGVNRVGKDGNGVIYSGESRIFGPKGERLDSFKANKEQVEIVELDRSVLEKFRLEFPANSDADNFEII